MANGLNGVRATCQSSFISIQNVSVTLTVVVVDGKIFHGQQGIRLDHHVAWLCVYGWQCKNNCINLQILSFVLPIEEEDLQASGVPSFGFRGKLS